MLLFKKYTMDIPCSKELFLQMLECKVYPCSMVRSVFPLDKVDEPFVGSVRRGKIKFRCRKVWSDGVRISRGLQPILHGTIVIAGDDRCTLVYRFFPDSLLFPFFLLWLAGMLHLIIQRGGNFYFLLPLLPLPPFFILTFVYSTCSAQTIKSIKELIQNACQIEKTKQ